MHDIYKSRFISSGSIYIYNIVPKDEPDSINDIKQKNFLVLKHWNNSWLHFNYQQLIDLKKAKGLAHLPSLKLRQDRSAAAKALVYANATPRQEGNSAFARDCDMRRWQDKMAGLDRLREKQAEAVCAEG